MICLRPQLTVAYGCLRNPMFRVGTLNAVGSRLLTVAYGCLRLLTVCRKHPPQAVNSTRSACRTKSEQYAYGMLTVCLRNPTGKVYVCFQFNFGSKHVLHRPSVPLACPKQTLMPAQQRDHLPAFHSQKPSSPERKRSMQ